MERRSWCEGFDLYRVYHDADWGVPLWENQALFELLILEGSQAGLSWSTVLKKRESYRLAFDHFTPEKIGRYDDQKIAELLANPGIIRNRLKAAATITNTRAYLSLQASGQALSSFLWQFVDVKPAQNARHILDEVPAKTPASDAMSKAPLKVGFKFVG